MTDKPRKSSISPLDSGIYDKWIFFAFIIATIAISFYFSNLSKGWEKPVFQDIIVQENGPTYKLNYQKDKENLVITSRDIEPIEVSCLTVEAELCGRGEIPYAYNYDLESANLVMIDGVKYFDRITYVVNGVDVSEMQTSIRSYAETKIAAYNKQSTIYIALVGIIFGLYLLIRFTSFSSSFGKKDD